MPAYGYWWWTCRDDELGDYFAARGNKGQFIVVIPERDVVVVRHGRDFGDVEDWVGAIADIASPCSARAGQANAVMTSSA